MESYAYLAAIVNSTDDAIISKDLNGLITSWNRAAIQIFGYTAEQAIGQPITILLPPDRLAEEETIIAQIKRGERIEHFETVRRSRDGRDIPISVTISPILSPDGTIVGASKIARDISAAKLAERELSAAQRRMNEWLELLHSLQASAPIGIGFLDTSCHYVQVNDALATIHHFPAQDHIGKPASQILQGVWPRVASMYLAVVEEGKCFANIEVRGVDEPSPNLERCWLLSLFPVRMLDAHIGIGEIVIDITDRRRLETELTQRTAELEKTLGERDLLLREVYHRVKNNLQIVDGLIMMQSRQLANSQAATALLDLRHRIQALALIHNQLMKSVNLRTFNVKAFLEELSANILDSGAAGDTTISVQAPPLDVELDFAIPLGLVVTELVTNSLKHAFPLRNGNITVTLEQKDLNGEIVLNVSDNGETREGNQIALDSLDMGLGIKIINGLVAQLGGTITVKHEQGMHTEIRIAEPRLR